MFKISISLHKHNCNIFAKGAKIFYTNNNMFNGLRYFVFIIVQSAKILLLPPKYEIIMVPSNHSNFQYYDSNIGLFSNAPCRNIGKINIFKE